MAEYLSVDSSIGLDDVLPKKEDYNSRTKIENALKGNIGKEAYSLLPLEERKQIIEYLLEQSISLGQAVVTKVKNDNAFLIKSSGSADNIIKKIVAELNIALTNTIRELAASDSLLKASLVWTFQKIAMRVQEKKLDGQALATASLEGRTGGSGNILNL